ncbi:MAG TPA: ABC transporter permease [Blastocatellia bacterium]|nr:ABC transporter permease [Blastocatellia bacterium]
MLIENIWQDCRYAIRTLRKNRGFTAVAFLTLALGIGANTAIFSVVNAVLLRPLPFNDPDKLALFYGTNRHMGFSGPWAVCDADYPDWKTQSESFGQIAAYQRTFLNLTNAGEPERLQASAVDADLFTLLGVQPELGRTFTADESQPGRDGVAVISHKLWQRRFGSDPSAVGKVVFLDGKSHTLIGVMPAFFDFPNETDLWAPLVLTPECDNAMNQVITRLKQGVSLRQAQESVAGTYQSLSERHHQRDEDSEMTVISLQESMVSNTKPVLLILLGAVSLVLLIACANVANLLLARAAGRGRELAIRRALGASRWRLIRQLLVESVILSLLGGIGGVLFAVWALDGLLVFLPPGVPRAETIEVDRWMLAFALGVAIVSGIVFGLLPALHSSKPDLSASLKEGDRYASGGRSGRRVRSLLVVSEFALAMVLLIAAGLLIRSFIRLTEVEPGFDTSNLLTMNVLLPQSRYSKPAQMVNFYKTAIERFRNVPGVRAAGAVFGLPLGEMGVRGDFTIEGQSPPAEGVNANKLVVSTDYLRAMRIPLVKGRFFTEADTDKSEPVVIISKNMAEMFWPGEDPIGERLQPGFRALPMCTVVGVVGDIHSSGFAKNAPLSIYMPHSQGPVFLLSAAAFVVRTEGDPRGLANTFSHEVQQIDRELPLFDVRTMEQLVSRSVSEPRFNMMLLTFFSGLALALASVGIYGVMACSVAERTREIGIRMALGAEGRDVLRLVLRQGTALIVVGVGLGLLAGLAVTRVIASFLFEVSASDPATFVSIALLLGVVALLACYIPARRATRVDPMVALRCG